MTQQYFYLKILLTFENQNVNEIKYKIVNPDSICNTVPSNFLKDLHFHALRVKTDDFSLIFRCSKMVFPCLDRYLGALV